MRIREIAPIKLLIPAAAAGLAAIAIATHEPTPRTQEPTLHVEKACQSKAPVPVQKPARPPRPTPPA